MSSRFLTVLLSVALGGCSSVQAEKVVNAAAVVEWHIKCEDKGDCFAKASEICGPQYQIEEDRTRDDGFVIQPGGMNQSEAHKREQSVVIVICNEQ